MSDRLTSSSAPVPEATRARSAVAPVRQRVPAPRTSSGLGRLQHAAGNLAMHRLLRSAGIQPKLTINRPDDEYEREADRVADEVMRMPATPLAIQRHTPIVQCKCAACQAAEHDTGDTSPIQRKCAACEAEDEEEPHGHVQAKRIAGACADVQRACAACEAAEDEGHGDALVQSKSESASQQTAPVEVEQYLNNSRGGGERLPSTEREYFESRLGHDLGGVRVHTGSEAANAATAINARAFTSGHDLFFGSGQFAPGSASGRQLLAHELTHVIQQSEAPAAPPESGADRKPSDESDAD